MANRRKIETYPYTVLKTLGAIEIREYEASLFTSVTIPSNEYRTASSKGFSILGGYIFGGNHRNEKIAMTSPVAMSLEDSMTVMFMVPKGVEKESLPNPHSSAIRFREEPSKIMATITFGGWANDRRIEKYKQKLVKALNSAGVPHTNHYYIFGYNPPYDILNRKNEVVVELAEGWKKIG